MATTIISHVLLRAPLLPVSALEDAAAALTGHPLGAAALALASPDLHAALLRDDQEGSDPGDAVAALGRYGRRAAFRPTPVGLLAGVAAGRLGDGTRLSLGQPLAEVHPSWGRLAALGRALLDEPRVRAGVRLRRAPSLLRSAESLVWLSLGRDGLEEQSALADDTVTAVLAASERWVSWATVRRRLAAHTRGGRRSGSGSGLDPEDLDAFLLDLIDQGLLLHDLTPPLLGEPAAAWMIQRLRSLSVPTAAAAAAELERARELLTAGRDLPGARSVLAALPGAAASAAGAPDLHGLLAFPSAPESLLDRAAVERAASLAPLLFRLQEASAAPVAERELDPELHRRLRSIAEVFGAGAYDPAALACSAHGLALSDGSESASPPASWSPALLSFFTEALLAAASAGENALVLTAQELEERLPAAEVPGTFELCLTPARRLDDGGLPGSGWLVGLHAPAGASFGRFAAAPGAPAAPALAELAAAEARRPGEQRIDVVSAPSTALADLTAHPPLRLAALALTGWPAEPTRAITPAELEVVLDDTLPGEVGLRLGRSGARSPAVAVAPSPLHRVRSTTVPPGLFRLLAGWSLARQHAPWLFTWGPFGGLPFLPRLVLEGFVLAPASWRIPAGDELASDAALDRWRERARVPARVQLGQGDELLPVDLTRPGARADLLRAAGGRVHEIWPPLDRLVDDSGRRVEAVVAVLTEPSPLEQSAAARVAAAGPVPSPAAAAAAAPGWRTFRIFGPAEGQDAVLHEAVAPTLSRMDRHRWFFIRYEEPGSGRPHLRLRIHASRPAQLEALTRRLERALSPLRSAGLVATLEQAEYFRETARYGGAHAMDVAEAIFQAGSDLVLETLALESQEELPFDADRRPLFARAADALASGLGLDRSARLALAESRRTAYGPTEDPAWRVELRSLGRQLESLLAGREQDAATVVLSRYRDGVAAAVRRSRPAVRAQLAAALPALLHTQAVRMLGAQPEDEQAGYFFWARTLASVGARARRAPEGRAV